MIFYTVIRFNLYRNGSVRKYQRLYKTPRKFKTKEKAVRYANELFKNKNCLCIQVDLNDEFGVIETVFEKTRWSRRHKDGTLRFEKDGNIIEIENYREEIKEKFNRLLVETSEESRFYDEGTSYTIDDKGQKAS